MFTQYEYFIIKEKIKYIKLQKIEICNYNYETTHMNDMNENNIIQI